MFIFSRICKPEGALVSVDFATCLSAVTNPRQYSCQAECQSQPHACMLAIERIPITQCAPRPCSEHACLLNQVAKKAFKQASMRRIARPRPEWPAPLICTHLVGIVLAPEPTAVPSALASVPRLPRPVALSAAARMRGRAEPPADAPGDQAVGIGSRAPSAALAQVARARATATALREPLLEPLQPGRERAVEPSQAQAAAERANKRQRTEKPEALGGVGGLQAPRAEAQPGRPPHGHVATPTSRATAHDAQLPTDAPPDTAGGGDLRPARAAPAQQTEARSTAAAARTPPCSQPAVETDPPQAAMGRPSKRARITADQAGGLLQAPLAEAQPERPPHEPVATPSSRATTQPPMDAQEDSAPSAGPRAPRAQPAQQTEARSKAAAARPPPCSQPAAEPSSPLLPGMPAPAGRVSPRDLLLQPAQAAGVPQQQAGHGPEAQPDPGTSPTPSTRQIRRNRRRLSGPPQRAPEF